MTEARAVARYLRIGPRKVRLVADTIRKQPVDHALVQLMHRPMKAARLITNVLNSAIANAAGKKMDRARLIISEIKVDGGPSMKRYLPRAMGRADRILKRSSHITVVLREGAFVPFTPAKPLGKYEPAKKVKMSRTKLQSEKEKTEGSKKEGSKKLAKTAV
ncbi:MAG: 50S ribosomal protein L22 [Candidatus Omnitrophica bacterium]|nr:50S ribosomal protein L22 [Candidatus Omnitrophota bacterium]